MVFHQPFVTKEPVNINCLKVSVFLAFVGLSVSCYTAWNSGTEYVVAFSNGIHHCCIRFPYKALATVASVLGQTIRPSSIHRQANGLQDRRRPMRVNDCLRMELMAECLRKQPAFLMQERPWSPAYQQTCHSSIPCFQKFWH